MAYTESNPVAIGGATKKSNYDTLWDNVAAIWAGLVGKVTITQPATGSTLTIADGKTITCTQDTALDEAVAMSSKVTKGGSGQVVNTTLPAFLAYNSTTDSDVTGDGTVATVDFDTELFDQGANFAADTFTAPITGRYWFEASVFFQGLTANHSGQHLTLVTSNRSYSVREYFNAGANPLPTRVMQIGRLVDMDAADTVYVVLQVENGTKVVDIYGSDAAILFTSFSGHLVC